MEYKSLQGPKASYGLAPKMAQTRGHLPCGLRIVTYRTVVSRRADQGRDSVSRHPSIQGG